MVNDEFYWWEIFHKNHDEYLSILENKKQEHPWCSLFLNDFPLSPGNLNSKCRIGYVPYDKCKKDYFFFLKKAKEMDILASGGITTQIYIDDLARELPKGWQDSVNRSYSESVSGIKPNTLVALLAFTSPRFRGKGLSGQMISKMCDRGRELGYKQFIVPALPPAQFEKNNVSLGMEELLKIKRDDGSYYDYWVRLHIKKGARLIGSEERSHRFALNFKDFNENVSSFDIPKSGQYTINFDRDRVLGSNGKNMWCNVHANKELDLISFDWGCVWFCYDI